MNIKTYWVEPTAREMDRFTVIETVESDRFPCEFGIWNRSQTECLGVVMANNKYEAVAKYLAGE